MSTKTKTALPRRAINGKRRIAADASLRTLDMQFHLRSGRSTSEFIERHPGVSAALLSLRVQIASRFGRTMPTIEAISDPEESSEKLRVQIHTTLPPRKAMDALESVENAWLGNISPSLAGLFVLTVAPE
jgi:hypothetical protein